MIVPFSGDRRWGRCWLFQLTEELEKSCFLDFAVVFSCILFTKLQKVLIPPPFDHRWKLVFPK